MFDRTLETVNGDDINWQELVFQEITTSPQLQVNESYQVFFERAQRELLKPIAELTDKNKCLQSGPYTNFLPINALMLVPYNCEILLKNLLDNFRVNINLTGDNVIYSDRQGASPLHYAAQRGKLLYVKWLLERGADIYERTSCSVTANNYYIQPGFNALAYAAKEGHAEIMQVLLDHDVKIGKGDLYTRSSNPYSCMPLHLAAGSGSIRAVTLLFEYGASKDIQTEYKGETPLHYACEKGFPEVIKYLLEKGAIHSLSKTNLNNYTPLHLAAKNGHFDAVKLLIQWGAKINFITGSRNRSDTVLGCSFLSGNKQLILFLIENGADVCAPNLNNQKPLHIASKFGDLDILLALLEKGAKADIYKMTPNKELPAHFAAEAGKADALALLLAHGTNINVVNNNGLTLLHLAARSGDTKTCELLMRRGLKECLNTSVGLFGTPLQCAIKANQYATVEFFLQQGANIDVTTSYDKTCLHLAVEVENIQILELLLKTDARKYINTKTQDYLYEEMTPLHIAIKKHLLDHIKLLFAEGADVCISAKHNSCLQLALENTSYSYNQPENTEEIIRLLWVKSTETDRRRVDFLGQNLLHLAAKRYDIKSMLFLLNHGLDDLLMQKNFEQRTPLDVLEKNEGSSEIIKFMNQFGLKLQDLRTPATEKLIDKFIDILQLQFYEAINRDRLDQAKSILEQLPKEVSKEIIHKRDKQGQTPLFIASKNGSTKVVRFLLSLNIDINQYCYDGSYYSSAFSYLTPLAASIVNNKEEIVKLLISAGAIINNAYLDATGLYKIEEFSESLRKSIIPEGIKIEADTNIYQTVPLLHLAAKMGHVVIMELLLKEAPININEIDQSGFSALQWAIKNDKVEAVKSLIAQKVNINLASSKDSLPIILAIKNTQILKILLEAGAEINHANQKGLTPIFYAIKSKCTESVQLLLQYKAEINQFSAERKTPLMVAVKKGNLAVIKLLLEADAQVNAVDSKGRTALFYAIESREIKKVKLLLDYKSDINHISNKPNSLTDEEEKESYHEIFLETDMTPLMLAAAKGNSEILQLLLKYHADLKQLTAAKASPLMFAVYNGHIQATSLLIKQQGCPINQVSLKGDSALLIAVSRGHIEIVKLLLDKSADPNLANMRGRTPLFAAMTKLPNLQIIRMLIEAGAQIKIPEGLSGYDFNDAIYTMVKENDRELLKFLIEKGITIKEKMSAHKDKNFIRSYSPKKSLVLMATENNAYEMVELLIKLGCEVNEIYATYKDDTEVTKKIYKTRQHYHYRNQSYYDQETNEYYPASGSEEEEEEETITIKGDHYTLTITPIHVAIQHNNLKLVQLLITAGANVNQSITIDNNVLPLHLAFNLTYFDIAETLITNGADVNQACSASRYPRKYKGAPSSLTIAFSPLLLAAVNDKSELVDYLILKEAYLALPPKKTLTPPSWDLISFPIRDSFSSIKRDEVKKTNTLEEILERRLNCSIEVFESAPTGFQVLVLMGLAHESFVSKHQKLADECLRKAFILNPDKLINFFEYLLQGKLISKCSERELTFLIDTILQMTKSNKNHHKKVSFIIASHIMSSDNYSDLNEKLLISLVYSIAAGDYPGATTLKAQAFNLLLNQKGLSSSMSQMGVTLDNFENLRKIVERLFSIKEDKDSLTFPTGCLDRFGLFGDSIRQLKKLPSTDIYPSQDDALITKITLPQRRNSI